MEIPKAMFCWSGGKDSAFCLNKVLQEGNYEVVYLLTTVNDEFKRVSMHGTREELLDQQAVSIGLPLLKVRVREGSNQEYEKEMETTLLKAASEGITCVIFGDIFLEDLRTYRESNLAKVGLRGVFPLWNADTRSLIRDFIHQKFKTRICCVNDGYLGEEWLGREIDESFLETLPDQVDPCGENGEYHTFCYDGPLFKNEIRIKRGESVYKKLELKTKEVVNSQENTQTRGFWFCDLLPLADEAAPLTH